MINFCSILDLDLPKFRSIKARNVLLSLYKISEESMNYWTNMVVERSGNSDILVSFDETYHKRGFKSKNAITTIADHRVNI